MSEQVPEPNWNGLLGHNSNLCIMQGFYPAFPFRDALRPELSCTLSRNLARIEIEEREERERAANLEKGKAEEDGAVEQT